MFHDLGKYNTTTLGEDKLYHCKNHAIESEKIVRALNIVGEDWLYIKESVCSLVRWHMQPLYILNHKNPKAQILKLANNLKCVFMNDLLLLKKCDCEGSVYDKNDNYLQTLNDVRKLYYNTCTPQGGSEIFIIKVDDSKECPFPKNNHPNGINKGYSKLGILQNDITVGFRVNVSTLSTSPVVEIIDKYHFKTKNSIYKIVELKNL